jgi:D-glycero-D-manno-heptose 1,7-bisphosphate phosphatase
MKRAVFLDRDGVINRPVVREGKPYPPASVAEFELLPGVIEACGQLKAAGFLLVVATNQPDVGRGTQRREDVEAMHAKMGAVLPLDRVEVCYDPGQGQPSEFRKPAPGMLLRAARELGIDLAQSWMVGDRWRDIDCGVAAGCRTVFIDYGYDEKLRAQPDFRVASLLAAVPILLGKA